MSEGCDPCRNESAMNKFQRAVMVAVLRQLGVRTITVIPDPEGFIDFTVTETGAVQIKANWDE